MVSSGLRIGTSALATRGLEREDFERLGGVIAAALGPDFEATRDGLAAEVADIARRYPLYGYLEGSVG
jgi:glycine hydroxymethyltransferase